MDEQQSSTSTGTVTRQGPLQTVNDRLLNEGRPVPVHTLVDQVSKDAMVSSEMYLDVQPSMSTGYSHYTGTTTKIRRDVNREIYG